MPTFTKRIIRPGTYTVPRSDGTSARIHIGPQRIRSWLTTFDRMRKTGLAVPAPWRHDERALPVRLDGDRMDTDAYNNAGFWKRLWVDEGDGSLYGEVDVPREDDADRLGKTVVDVSLLAKPRWTDGQGNAYEDALTHIALVTHPVAPDNETFHPSETESIACSLGDLIMADVTPSNPGVTASSATVLDAIRMLGDMDPPIALPTDTDVSNFLERLVVALNALKSAQDDNTGEEPATLLEQPKGSREKPGPIAMSTDNPTPEVPPVTPEPQADPAPLSPENQAALNFATKTVKNHYQARIEALVKAGRISPKFAKEKMAPLVGDLKLAFDAEGNPEPTPLDLVLAACEDIPAHSVLTGLSPTTAKASKGGIFSDQSFSLSADLTEVPPPDHDALPDAETALTEDQVDDLVEAQFKAGGYRADKIEGGYRT